MTRKERIIGISGAVAKEMPSQEFLRAILDYDPLTGVLTWRERPKEMFSDGMGRSSAASRAASWNAKNARRLALAAYSMGYLHGTIGGKTYRSHRIIWKWMTGEEPVEVDHINGVRDDNRWANLRSVSHHENGKNKRPFANNASGVAGVSFKKENGKWAANIKVNGRSRHLGYFGDFIAAVIVRREAEKNLGFHPNHGRVCLVRARQAR